MLLEPVADETLRLPVERNLIGESQILKPPALHAPDVIVPAMGNLKMGRLRPDLVLLDAALLGQPPQVPIDRAQADRGKPASSLVENLMRRRMVVAPI